MGLPIKIQDKGSLLNLDAPRLHLQAARNQK
jgi:hypothetical protein